MLVVNCIIIEFGRWGTTNPALTWCHQDLKSSRRSSSCSRGQGNGRSPLLSPLQLLGAKNPERLSRRNSPHGRLPLPWRAGSAHLVGSLGLNPEELMSLGRSLSLPPGPHLSIRKECIKRRLHNATVKSRTRKYKDPSIRGYPLSRERWVKSPKVETWPRFASGTIGELCTGIENQRFRRGQSTKGLVDGCRARARGAAPFIQILARRIEPPLPLASVASAAVLISSVDGFNYAVNGCSSSPTRAEAAIAAILKTEVCKGLKGKGLYFSFVRDRS